MQVKVKKLSDTKVELTVTLGKEELSDAKLVALKKLSRKVKVPGFREGRAPASVAEKHIDANVLSGETLENAVSKAVAQAFMKQDIRALNTPQIEVTKYVPGESVEFKAVSEVFPEVELGDYKKLKAKMPKLEVKEQEVKDVLSNIQSSFSDKKEVKRAAKEGDEVVLDFTGKKDGEVFDGGTAKDHTLTLGSKSFIPGFEEGVVGHKSGEKFTIDVTFPKDYHAKNLAGAKVAFDIVLHKVSEITKPKLDDELAKKAGPFKTLVELKKDIKSNLLERKKHEATEKLKDDLVLELANKSTVPLPEILVDDQSQGIKRDMEQNLVYRGMTLDSYLESVNKTEEEWLETDVKKAAEDRVRTGLTLAELSKALKIDVAEDEIEAKLDDLRQHHRENKAVLEQIKSEGARNDIRNHLLTEKTIAELMKVNNI